MEEVPHVTLYFVRSAVPVFRERITNKSIVECEEEKNQFTHWTNSASFKCDKISVAVNPKVMPSIEN